MIALAALFLYLTAYITTESVKKEDSLSTIYSSTLDNIIVDIRWDLQKISKIDMYYDNEHIVLSNIKKSNYTNYLNFINEIYSKKINIPLYLFVTDSFISEDYLISPSNITVLSSNHTNLNIKINIDNYSFVSQNVVLGTHNLEISFFNSTNDFLFSFDENIDISQSQSIILSNNTNLTIDLGNIYFNIPYEHSFDIYIDKNDTIYFDSFLNMSVKNYGYEGKIRLS